MARLYSRNGIDIPSEYTICPCNSRKQQPETLDNFTQCPLAQEGFHLAKWKSEDMIAQHAGWGPATPPANEVGHLIQKPEIKGAVLRGAVPLELYRGVADNAPKTKARVSHIQLTAIQPADAQLQHRVQWYTQAAPQAPSGQRTYYNLLLHYQPAQPTD